MNYVLSSLILDRNWYMRFGIFIASKIIFTLQLVCTDFKININVKHVQYAQFWDDLWYLCKAVFLCETLLVNGCTLTRMLLTRMLLMDVCLCTC